MTPSQKISKSFSVALAFLCMVFITHAQTVTISGTQPVNIGCENKYTAAVSNIPTGWTVVGYKWQATFVGTNGGYIKYIGKDVNGNQIPITVTTANGIAVNAETAEFWVNWDNTFAPSCQIQVIFKIRYTLSGSQSINESQEFFLKDGNGLTSVCLKGIPTNPTFTGPATVQKCCISNVTYTASNVGDATTFDNWTFPTGWTQVSQTGNSITLTPNSTSAGSITCRAGIPTACPAYYQAVTFAITRTDAVITTVPSMFKENRICPGEVLQYAVNPVCGATDYIWQFPTGFNITGYANNKAQANVTVGNTAVSGNVTVTAVFNGCPSVNLIKALTVLTGAPAAAPTLLTDAPNYHCDAWYVCRNGSLSIPFNSIVPVLPMMW